MPLTRPIIFLKGEFRDGLKSFGLDEKTGLYYVQFKNGDNYLSQTVPLSLPLPGFFTIFETLWTYSK